MGCRRELGEIESKSACDQRVSRLQRRHITGGDLQGGYSRMAPHRKGSVEGNLKTNEPRFDWGETLLYSALPNSEAIMQEHLLNAVRQPGPKCLTGARVGPERSVSCFLTIALQFLVVMWLFPRSTQQN